MKKPIIVFCVLASLTLPASAFTEREAYTLGGIITVGVTGLVAKHVSGQNIRMSEAKKELLLQGVQALPVPEDKVVMPFYIHGKAMTIGLQRKILSQVGTFEDVHVSYWDKQNNRAHHDVIRVLENGDGDLRSHLKKLAHDGAKIRSVVVKSNRLETETQRILSEAQESQRLSKSVLNASHSVSRGAGVVALFYVAGKATQVLDQAIIDHTRDLRSSRQAQ